MSAQDQVGFWSGLGQLYRMLSPHRRRQFYLVIGLMVAGAFAELATIGAIIPFLSLLADPHHIEHLPLITAAFDAVGATSDRQRLIAATGLFIVLALVAGAVRLQLAWSSQNFVFRLGHDFSVDIQRRLLLQPYTFHIGQNTSTLVAALEKVGVLTFTVLQQVIQAGIAVFIALFIIALLVMIDPLSGDRGRSRIRAHICADFRLHAASARTEFRSPGFVLRRARRRSYRRASAAFAT